MTSKGKSNGANEKTFESIQVKTLLQSIIESDEKKMAAVKDILLSNWENPLSLKELARKVDTNDYHLKKHFKMVFGMTVFNHLYQ